MTVRINKQKINLREKLAEFEDKVNFDEVIRSLGEYTGNVGIGATNPVARLNIKGDSSGISTSGEIFRIDTSDSDGCRLTFGVDSTNEFGWIRAVRPGSESDLILQGLGGAVGIGTGFSTNIPQYNPNDIIDSCINICNKISDENINVEYDNDIHKLYNVINDIDIENYVKFYLGFKGTIKKNDKDIYERKGIYNWLD